MPAADGPAFVAAAVSAAVRAKAPRRTIQAVAAAVAGVFVHPPTVRATPRTSAAEPARAQGRASEMDGDPTELLNTLRAARAAQRRRKKERRRAAKASSAAVKVDVEMGSRGGGEAPATTPNRRDDSFNSGEQPVPDSSAECVQSGGQQLPDRGADPVSRRDDSFSSESLDPKKNEAAVEAVCNAGPEESSGSNPEGDANLIARLSELCRPALVTFMQQRMQQHMQQQHVEEHAGDSIRAQPDVAPAPRQGVSNKLIGKKGSRGGRR